MVDTIRTRAALQALLADNATGDISPQDLRDFLASAPLQLGAYFSAIVDSDDMFAQSAAGLGLGNVYAKMQDAITDGHKTIFYKKSTDAADITIAGGDAVVRIVGAESATTGFPVNLACDKADVAIEYLQFLTKTLTANGDRMKVFACVFATTGNMMITANDVNPLSCVYIACSTTALTIDASTAGTGHRPRVTSCSFLSNTGTNCVSVICEGTDASTERPNIVAIVGSLFSGNACTGYLIDFTGTAADFGAGPETTTVVRGGLSHNISGCVFKDMDYGGILIRGSGWVLSGNVFDGTTQITGLKTLTNYDTAGDKDTDLNFGNAAASRRRAQGFTLNGVYNVHLIQLYLRKFAAGHPATERLKATIKRNIAGLPGGGGASIMASGDSGIAANTTYGAGAPHLTDVSKTWFTNELAGQTVTASGGKTGVVASNTPNAITLVAGWSGGGAPGADETWNLDYNGNGLNDGNVGGAYQFAPFVFPSKIAPSTAEGYSPMPGSYWVEIQRVDATTGAENAADAVNYYQWGGDQSAPGYAGGRDAVYDSGPGTWSLPGTAADLLFNVQAFETQTGVRLRQKASSISVYLSILAGNVFSAVQVPIWVDVTLNLSTPGVNVNGNIFSGNTPGWKLYMGNRCAMTGNLVRGSGSIIDWQSNLSGSTYASNLEFNQPTMRNVGSGGLKTGTTNTSTGMYESLVPETDNSIDLGSSTKGIRKLYRSGPAAQAIALAADQIAHTSDNCIVSNTTGGAITLTSTPTITDGVDGEEIWIVNVGTQDVVLQDQGTLANSNLRLGAATRTLGPRDNITLVYSADVGDWVEKAFNNVI